jgi:hypothetical protein
MIFFSFLVTVSDNLSYNNISENVEAVSANGNEASDTNIDLPDADIL